MQLGMVGLGRMGGNMTTRLVRGGHQVVGQARRQELIDAVVAQGARGASTLADLVKALAPPRVVWVMLPAGDPTESALRELGTLLAPGDIIVDGGNSYYKETIRHSAEAASRGLHFVDVGTSGGIWGVTEGYSMMVGGTRRTWSASGPPSRRSPRPRMPVGAVWAATVRATSSRWSTTGSSTA